MLDECVPRGAWRCDIHLHSGDDPQDGLPYSTDALFARAAARGLHVVSLTLHDAWSYSEGLAARARDHGLFLIPGIEKTIEGRHVLIYNADRDAEAIESFADLRDYKRPEMFVMAPHPFFPAKTCLREKLLEHIDVFDAVEFAWFYHPKLNWNRMAERVAAEHGLPLVCTSDSHSLDRVGTCYSTVDGALTVDGILEGMRRGPVERHTGSLSLPRIGMATMARAVVYAGRMAWEWTGAGGRSNATAA